jgi:hypothetical protein
MDTPETEHHGRDHLMTGTGLICEFCAGKYGISILAWAGGVFLFLAFFNYSRHYLSGKSARRRYALYGAGAAVLIVVTLIVTGVSLWPKRLLATTQSPAPAQSQSSPQQPITNVEPEEKRSSKKRQNKPAPKLEFPPVPPPPANSVSNPTGSIVNQDSPNYGSQTVNNIDTRHHLRISESQQSAITGAMRNFSGRKAFILCNGGTTEQVEFGKKMQAALEAAGIQAEFHTGVAMSEGEDAMPWLFVGWGEHNSDMANALTSIIRDAGVIPAPHVGIHFYQDGDKDGFQIIIGQPD